MMGLWIFEVALLAQSFDLALDEGIRRYWNGEYEATIDVLEPACTMNASSGEKIECHKYLAFSLVALGADDDAREQFSRLLSRDPGYRLDESLVSPKILVRFERARQDLAQSIYHNGKAAYHSEDFAKAIELLDQTLRLDPTNELAAEYRELGQERMRLSEAREAVAAPAEPPAPVAAPKPAAVLEDKVHRLTSDINHPVLLERVAPEYPRMARLRRVEGSVVVSIVIDRNGLVTQSKIIRSVDVHLDRTALDAVEAWRYQPATLNGFPVAVYGIIELSFELDDS